jgi:hypothetical protein
MVILWLNIDNYLFVAEFGGIMVKFKQLAVLCVLVFCCGNLFAQNTISEPSQSPTAQYRLFRTTNMWTFIKLDTVTGKMWQLQFDTQGDARGSIELNTRDLASGKQKTHGRFTLYPTTNMWTFILVDQIDGNTWQVQWSQERANRFILPID